MDRLPTVNPTSTAGYNWSGVIEFLITQYRQMTLKENEWELEKKDFQEKVIHLESSLKAQEGLNNDLMKRVKMLEVSLKKERMKFMAYLSKMNQEERDKILAEITNQNDSLPKRNENEVPSEKLDLELSKRRAKRQKDFLDKVLKEFDCTDILQDIHRLNDDDDFDRKRSHAELEEELMGSPLIESRGKNGFGIGTKFDRGEGEQATIKILSTSRFHTDEQKGLALLDEGRRVATVGIDGKLGIIILDQLLSGKGESSMVYSSSEERIGIHSVAARGTQIFTGSSEGRVRLWEAGRTLSSLDYFDFSTEIVNNIKVHPRENLVLASSLDGKIKSIEFKQGEFVDKKLAQNYVMGHSRTPQSLCWSPQGISQFAVTTQEDSEVYFFDMNSAKPTVIKLGEGKNSSARAITGIPNDNTYLAGGKDGRAYVIDPKTGRLVQKYEVSNDSITALSVSSDGMHFAIGCKNGVVKVWDKRTTRVLMQKEGHRMKNDDGVNSLLFLKEQNAIISGGADNNIVVYGLKDLY